VCGGRTAALADVDAATVRTALDQVLDELASTPARRLAPVLPDASR
jgi:hypothetical protein